MNEENAKLKAEIDAMKKKDRSTKRFPFPLLTLRVVLTGSKPIFCSPWDAKLSDLVLYSISALFSLNDLLKGGKKGEGPSVTMKRKLMRAVGTYALLM